jgi:hypothetical protein
MSPNWPIKKIQGGSQSQIRESQTKWPCSHLLNERLVPADACFVANGFLVKKNMVNGQHAPFKNAHGIEFIVISSDIDCKIYGRG